MERAMRTFRSLEGGIMMIAKVSEEYRKIGKGIGKKR
jgi:hypothetical protein